MKKRVCCLIVLSLAMTVFADTSAIVPSGVLQDVWGNGLPSESNPGRIELDGAWLVNGSTDFSKWVVTQTSGTLTRTGNPITFGNCKWQLDGGSLVVVDNSRNKAHVRVGDSKTSADLVMNGGKISAEGYFDVAFQSTFKQTGGLIEAKAGSRLSKGGQSRIEGGEAVLGCIHFSSPNTLLEFAGGSWAVAGDILISKGTVRSAIVRFVQGNGKLSVGNLIVNGPGYIDFSTGSTGAFTVKKFKEKDFERLWQNGTVRIDGENSGEFSELFTVADHTLHLKSAK